MAGGQWRMIIAPSVGTNAPTTVDAQFPYLVAPKVAGFNPLSRGFADPDNLLAYDRPTLMTNWMLSSLYLPTYVRFQYGVPPATPPNVSVLLDLLLNGEVVWAETQSPVLDTLYQAQMVFSADLFNAIVVSRGSRLALRLRVATDQASANPAIITAAFSARKNPAAFEGQEGTIGYGVQQLQGARRL